LAQLKLWFYFEQIGVSALEKFNIQSRAIHFDRQCHFNIWLDCHKFKKFSLLDYAHVNKVSKKEKK
jgi:hypothetical protein